MKVHAIEEMALEKLAALSDRARNEPRDLYDPWHLFGTTDLHIAEMRAELDAKLASRKRVVVQVWGMQSSPRKTALGGSGPLASLTR